MTKNKLIAAELYDLWEEGYFTGFKVFMKQKRK